VDNHGGKKIRHERVFCLQIGSRSTTFALGSSAAHLANELAQDAETFEGTAGVSGGGFYDPFIRGDLSLLEE